MDSLIDALKGKPLTKEFSFEGMRVSLRTLTQEEMDDVFRRTQVTNLMVQEDLIKRPILGYSLQSINGADIAAFPDVRDNLKKADKDTPLNYVVERVLGGLEVHTTNLLYELYLELAKESKERKDKLKNSLATQSTEPSGSSSKN